jgi:hypothetical protein
MGDVAVLGVIKLSESMTFKWFVNCGAGTNTKAELMGAWETLHISKISLHSKASGSW